VILTEDANTLTRWAEQLGKMNLCGVSPLLLKDGFRPDELVDPGQKTLGFERKQSDQMMDLDFQNPVDYKFMYADHHQHHRRSTPFG
jgi:hypothetical protein